MKRLLLHEASFARVGDRLEGVTPVTMGGEVVVGAGIPEEVELRPIPDSDQYSYLNVNGQPVIVDNSNRQIVYIVR